MQFVFVTAISISTSETQGKLTRTVLASQEEKQSKNLTSCGPALGPWEEADRCLNQGEMKIKTHCPLGKLSCWSLVATAQQSRWWTNPFSVAFQITLYLGKCCLLTGHPMSCFTSPGPPDSNFVAPCQWCAKMVTDYSVEIICEKLCFDEFVYFKKLRNL